MYNQPSLYPKVKLRTTYDITMNNPKGNRLITVSLMKINLNFK